MYEVAMFFSITSSILFCIYLLMCIFGTAPKQSSQTWFDIKPTIEIRGRVVTRTVTFTTMNENLDNDLQTYTMPTLIEQVKR